MPWHWVSIMDQRREFVALALQEGANRRELCRRFGISADTGYRWLARGRAIEELSREQAHAVFGDRSRRPHHSPWRSEEAIEKAVLKVRDAHPAWGARKIASCLERDGLNL